MVLNSAWTKRQYRMRHEPKNKIGRDMVSNKNSDATWTKRESSDVFSLRIMHIVKLYAFGKPVRLPQMFN